MSEAPEPEAPEREAGDAARSFRSRLLSGLQAAIEERGYRDTTVTDVVRHARASRRTFYQVFATKDDCFIALMQAANAGLIHHIALAVDPQAPWPQQARQAVRAYLERVAGQPAVFLCSVREFPSLSLTAQQVQRQSLDDIAELVARLADNAQFRAAGLSPPSRDLTLLVLGGLRELTARVIEEGRDVRSVLDVAAEATVAALGTSRPDRHADRHADRDVTG